MSNAQLKHKILEWANDHPFDPIQIDCTTTVMLKIIDGKCKMSSAEKIVMALLYDVVKHQPGKLFDEKFHILIRTARLQQTNEMKNYIYETRVLAETMLSRPVMKLYKAMLREAALFTAVQSLPVSIAR